MSQQCQQNIQIQVEATNKKQTIQMDLDPQLQQFPINLPHNGQQYQVPICRICLQEMRQQEKLNPCQCRGSNSYFHQECLMEWVRKGKKHRHSFRTYYHLCEICKGRIFLQTSLKYRCATLQQAKQELFEKNICCTITTVVFLFCSFTVLGIVLYISSMAQSEAEIAVYSIGLAITLATIIITILVFVFSYVIKTDVITVGISRNNMRGEESGKGKGGKVVPQKGQVQRGKVEGRRSTNNNSNNNNNTTIVNIGTNSQINSTQANVPLDLNHSLQGILITNNNINASVVIQGQN